MRRLTSLIALGTAALVVLGGVLIPGRAQASVPATPGATANQILIGTSLPQSGLAVAYGVIAGGEQAYFDYVNAHGGVNGRKLKLVALDDAYDPTRTLANVRNLVQARNVFALVGVLGTDNNLAVQSFLAQQKVPLIMPLTGSSAVIRPLRKYVFTYEPAYTVEARVLTDYAVKTLHAQKIAVFYQNDNFGKEGLNATIAEIQKLGKARYVAATSYSLLDIDMSAQVQKIQQSGADTVIMFAVPPSAGLFLRAAATTGLQVKYLSTSVGGDPAVLKALGAAGNGIYFADWLPDWARAKQTALYRSILTTYGTPQTTPIGPVTEGGVVAAQILVEGLKRAGKNLTRDGLVTALESIHNWNGGIASNVSYSATKHDGPEGVYVSESQNAQQNPSLMPVTPYTYPTYP